ncbi:zinc-binding dehydrogenase [Mucilaginibacter robiniae]|uniref:Zinc-binding dehydrogenase n=1 Tax=Mucilaginibacter robiniae TaxID=2728022 RepID=A0A7L5DZI1_9SPHI|nr:zinc-binding dehydrogenase [Mucilaginibacter robiniae]QJD96512.1 zinc-binding dehydrogenase [Mucilaginibacter robiniae]
MKAVVLVGKDQPLQLQDIDKPTLGAGEVLVKVKAAALNRRDYWITIGQYAGIQYPSVLGSDGSGIVAEVGEGVDQSWLNKEVIINPSHDWGEHTEYQSQDFKILGLPEYGTMAEYVKTKAEYLQPKPAHLNWEQAAAIPLAGLTAYRALFTKGRAKKGDKVLIVGVGSGTGSFALQWAVAAGCQVFVTSGSGDKIERAREMGAAAGVNYKAQDWADELKHMAGGFDVIIDSALGKDFTKVIDLCNPGARVVFFGATAGSIPELNARVLFWKQIQLLGTTMGTADEFKAMLDLINEYQIVPVIDEVFPLANAQQAVDKMGNSSQFGKLVLTL